ncbi:MAG: pilin [Patescibacteria group bacterium]|nr:pilin [Patescibacteria group bacterium]
MSITKILSTKVGLLFGAGMFVFALLAPVAAFAQGTYVEPDPTDPFGLGSAEDVNVGESDDLKGSIANVVNILLGFLGILAVVIIIYAGFKWMTAAGNEEQVGDAKKMLVQAVIGLVIIMMAWAITSFVTGQIGAAVQLNQ